ncbi:alkaline phosphatase family protein [Flavobacterium cupriresistens]|uniref:alkaline phosphatase family protein n=1 Tax=Flavobacterium cupriresistens TaxID=2893885 RepID=UPI003D173277
MENENQFDGLDTFDHIVVLMLENRSFDNLLGFLYKMMKYQRISRLKGFTTPQLTMRTLFLQELPIIQERRVFPLHAL